PRQGNDRLLLGLKGSLNEYELDLLRQRSLSARYEKARRGELIVAAPVGFVKAGVVPLAAGFLLDGGKLYVAMGCMAIVFVAAVTFAAHHFNRAFLSGVRLNLHLSDRTEELTERTRELIEVNTRLKEEMAQREAVENQLHQAQKMEALGQL